MFLFLSPFWFHWIFSQVQFTLLWLHIANAHILRDCLLWALSGRGKERMYLSVVSKVILCLNTKTSWGPFFPFVHSACYGDAMVILYLPRSAAFQATLRFPVGIGEVFTCFTLAANCFSPSPFDSHQTLSCSKRFDVRVGALIILWIVYVFMYSPSVNGFCVLLSHELPEN